jgi:hypothetical protein
MGLGERSMKILLALSLLLFTACSTTSGDVSKWKNMGPDQVHCKKHEFKMCSYYGALYICECKLA